MTVMTAYHGPGTVLGTTYIHVTSLDPPNIYPQPWRPSSAVIPILHMKKVRFDKLKVTQVSEFEPKSN